MPLLLAVACRMMVTTTLAGLVSEAEARALVRFAEMLRDRFGPRLREVRLFGSTARGERHEDSDIDVAVIVDQLDWREKREIHGWPFDVMMETGIYLSPVAWSSADFDALLEGERLIALDVRREGIPIEPS